MKAISLSLALLFVAISVAASPLPYPQALCDGCTVTSGGDITDISSRSYEYGPEPTEIAAIEPVNDSDDCDGCAVVTGTATTALPTDADLLAHIPVTSSIASSGSLTTAAPEEELVERCDGCSSGPSSVVEDDSTVSVVDDDKSESLESDSNCDGCTIVGGTAVEKL